MEWASWLRQEAHSIGNIYKNIVVHSNTSILIYIYCITHLKDDRPSYPTPQAAPSLAPAVVPNAWFLLWCWPLSSPPCRARQRHGVERSDQPRRPPLTPHS